MSSTTHARSAMTVMIGGIEFPVILAGGQRAQQSQGFVPSELKTTPTVSLSAEQQKLIDVVRDGHDAIVDATVGAGKTTAIQALCSEAGENSNVLYLTYSKLLKLDAQRRVMGAKVQNYHGVVYPSLLAAGMKVGISETIRKFNAEFKTLSATFPKYDLLVVDEYQDITEDYAELLRNIKSVNPLMQVVMVGDMAQKVRSDTTLDAQSFAREFCDNPIEVPFTQSFRVGPELAGLLSEAWNKPIVGVNTNQKVRTLSYDEAVSVILSHKPGELLCLGKRNGAMSRALNQIEAMRPEVFNKNTVYASIRDSDTSVSYGDEAAVFTTFDAAKGLERSVAIVFDYDEKLWDMRCSFPDTDPIVLRNIFLVAASRGKDEVIFVRPPDQQSRATFEHSIGSIPVGRFVTLPKVERPVYKKPWWCSDMFDFKYAENIEACFGLLETVRLDDGTAEPIEIERAEGLIDLSPVVGHFQEAAFFADYDAKRELLSNPSANAGMLVDEIKEDDPWGNSLVLTAMSTDQLRYVDQVKGTVSEATRQALVDRLSTLLPRDCENQVTLKMEGLAVHSRTEQARVVITGVVDAIHNDQIFELKFVSELTHPMFLQLALYLVLSGYESGVLWNTRTDERWEVRVPDRERFMNAVVLCVTKQQYRVFQEGK